jgi:lantibiotic ABC superfamily ATP binding cassette transporter, permease protein
VIPVTTPINASTMPRAAGPAAHTTTPVPRVPSVTRSVGSGNEAASKRRGAFNGRSGFVSLVAAEAIKLKRSSVWAVTILLPLLAVITGSLNFKMNREAFLQGWVSLTSQMTLFYAMMFCSLGVALLASTVWRVEHRGTSWNAMRTTPHTPAAVALAKTLVLFAPLLVMQVILVVLAWISGTFFMGLGPAMPMSFTVSALLGVLAAAPLVAVQSLLSMLMRSFAAPVAVAFIGCAVGFGLAAAQSPLAYAIPQGILSMTLVLGSSASSVAGSFDAASMLPLLAATVGVGAVLWGLLIVVTRRTGGVR